MLPLVINHTTCFQSSCDRNLTSQVWTARLQAMVSAPQGFNVSHMLQPALSVLVSMALGLLGGTALGAILNAKPAWVPRAVAALGRLVPQPVIARYFEGLYAPCCSC